MNLYKTFVYKSGSDFWTVNYYMPYSGRLIVFFDTWREAMDEACEIEKYKVWA